MKQCIFCLEFAGSGGILWYSVARTHIFNPAVWFRREWREALFFVDMK
jgi:hypothetical protein